MFSFTLWPISLSFRTTSGVIPDRVMNPRSEQAAALTVFKEHAAFVSARLQLIARHIESLLRIQPVINHVRYHLNLARVS